MGLTGRKEQIMFAGNDKSPLPQQSLLNIPAIYVVQWDANKQKYKAYFKSFGQEGAPPQQQAAPPQQAPPARDDRNTSIERQCVVKAVAEIAAHRPEMSIEDMMSLAVTFHDWVATGNVGPDFSSDEPAF
jgi:hypothetical protein